MDYTRITRLRFTTGPGFTCGGTSSCDMTRPVHRTLTGQLIRDDCEFCFRGTRLVLHRA